jgi:biopolymer transport protein ExbB/TolQ
VPDKEFRHKTTVSVSISIVTLHTGTSASLPDQAVIERVHRALRCMQANIHVDLKRGLSVLVTIACTAPLVGLFGTVLGILIACRGWSGQYAVVMAALVDGISQALVTTLAGLFVAVAAAWSYKHLVAKLEAFDIEMESSSLELMTYLVIFQSRAGRAK